jgi:hypothetical protein
MLKMLMMGEWFKFRIHYGIVNAGYATLEVKDAIINKKIFHVVGKGYTTGMSLFFSKWMTCMKVISGIWKSSKICKEDQ